MYRIRIKLGGVLGELHMSKRDLADLCDMRPGTAGDWVNEIIEHISLVHLARICEELELSLSEVLELETGGAVPDPSSRKERIQAKTRKVRAKRRHQAQEAAKRKAVLESTAEATKVPG